MPATFDPTTSDVTAIGSKGCILWAGTIDPVPAVDGDTYKKMCFVTQWSDSGTTAEEIDVTTTCSPARQFIGGYTDNGTVTITANFVPGAPTYQRLKEILESGKPGNFAETFPDDGLGNGEVQYMYKALITNIGRAIAVGSQVTATITLRKSGEVIEVLPTPAEEE